MAKYGYEWSEWLGVWFTVIIINLEKMKDRKYSDTSDAFLCEILSKKCN